VILTQSYSNSSTHKLFISLCATTTQRSTQLRQRSNNDNTSQQQQLRNIEYNKSSYNAL